MAIKYYFFYMVFNYFHILHIFGVTALLMATMLLTFVHQVFTGSYEKNQVISQVDECGKFWFPPSWMLDVIIK